MVSEKGKESIWVLKMKLFSDNRVSVLRFFQLFFGIEFMFFFEAKKRFSIMTEKCSLWHASNNFGQKRDERIINFRKLFRFSIGKYTLAIYEMT